MNSEELLIRYYEEQYRQIRHVESQRATLTNYLIIIAAALLALIGGLNFSLATLPMSILLLLAFLARSLH